MFVEFSAAENSVRINVFRVLRSGELDQDKCYSILRSGELGNERRTRCGELGIYLPRNLSIKSSISVSVCGGEISDMILYHLLFIMSSMHHNLHIFVMTLLGEIWAFLVL